VTIHEGGKLHIIEKGRGYYTLFKGGGGFLVFSEKTTSGSKREQKASKPGRNKEEKGEVIGCKNKDPETAYKQCEWKKKGSRGEIPSLC